MKRLIQQFILSHIPKLRFHWFKKYTEAGGFFGFFGCELLKKKIKENLIIFTLLIFIHIRIYKLMIRFVR